VLELGQARPQRLAREPDAGEGFRQRPELAGGRLVRRGLAAADELEAGMTGDDVPARLLGFARAYIEFATRHAALLELMFAGKQRSAPVHAASDRAFAAPLAMIVEAQAAGEVVRT